jgi:hypothetical protein
MPEPALAARRRRLVLAGCLLAALISVPSLTVGLVADDYFHQSYLLDHLKDRETRGPWWNMFDAREGVVEQMVAYGALPWWTSPHLKVALFRPLATMSHYVDYLLWPAHPVLMHVHNIVLYVLVVFVACHLYARLMPAPAIAAWIAAISYAIDDGHALGTAWIASRNTLLTALFALTCLGLYHRGRERGDRRAAWLAILALVLAHASSEGAIGIWAYLLAHAAFLDPASPRARLRALAPLAAASVCWLLLASLLGFGVSGSGAYLDPRTQPLEFLAALPERLSANVLAQFGLVGELGTYLPWWLFATIHGLVIAGLLVGAWAFVRVGRRQPVASFFVFGCLFSLLPICAVGAVGRLLYISGFGAHGAFALLVVGGWSVVQPQLRKLARALGVAATFAAVAIALAGSIAAPRWWKNMHENFMSAALSLPRGEKLGESVILVLNAPDYIGAPFIMLYRRLFAAPGPVFMHLLGVSTEPVRVSRLDDKSILLAPEGGYLAEDSSTLVRARSERFHPQQRVPLLAALVHVEQVTSDGRPAAVRVETFGLDNPRLLWVVWDATKQRYVDLALPPAGQTVVVPGAPPPDWGRPFSAAKPTM